MGIEARFLHALRNQLPFHSVLIGLSGGSDSVALTALTAKMALDMKYSVTVARVAHRLRPDEEDREERHFCRNFCANLDLAYVDLELVPGEIHSAQKRLGCGIEQAARTARHHRLQSLLSEIGAEYLFLGHTADDQLETVLMRVFSGAGPEGLKGIPVRRGSIFRPLMGETRENLRQWLVDMHIPWIDDPSNNAASFRRNRIRNELIPVLANIVPGWSSGVHNLAERSKDLTHALEYASEALLPAVQTHDAVTWSIDQWKKAPQYLRAHEFIAAVNHLCPSTYSDRRIRWVMVLDACRTLQTSGKWNGYGLEARCSSRSVKLVRMEDSTVRFVFTEMECIHGIHSHVGPWQIEVCRSAVHGFRSFCVKQDDWPLVLSIRKKRHKIILSLQGRSMQIPERPSNFFSEDGSDEMIYIQIMRDEEGIDA